MILHGDRVEVMQMQRALARKHLLVAKLIEQGVMELSDGEICRAFEGTVAKNGNIKAAHILRDAGELTREDLFGGG